MPKTGRPYYIYEDRYLPLPEWAYYFISLGKDAASARNKDRRLIIAAALPTRTYIAALTALGVVCALLTEPASDKSIAEVWSNMSAGTPVVVQEGTKRMKGEYCGLKRFTDDNRLRIGVHISVKKGGNLTRWFLPERCAISRLPSGSAMFLPEQKQESEILKNQRFIEGFVAQEDIYAMITRSYLGCLIVGHLNILRAELRETAFAVGPELFSDEHGKQARGRREGDGQFVEGTIHDVLRVRKFLGPDQTFMTDVFPAEARSPYEDIKETSDSVIIFDGATAFVKWRGPWPYNTRIVLLDRTDSRFEEAVQLINSEYVVRTGDPTRFSLKDSPSGIEVVAFLGG